MRHLGELMVQGCKLVQDLLGDLGAWVSGPLRALNMHETVVLRRLGVEAKGGGRNHQHLIGALVLALPTSLHRVEAGSLRHIWHKTLADALRFSNL